MRLVRWLAVHPFVAGVVLTLAAVLLACPGSWLAQYGVRKTVVEDGALLAVGYVTPAFSSEWSIEAAPYAAPAPTISAAPKSKAAAQAAPNRRRNRS